MVYSEAVRRTRLTPQTLPSLSKRRFLLDDQTLSSSSENPLPKRYRRSPLNVNGLEHLAHPQFFLLTSARSKRGEGPSRTLNKGVAFLWFTGGLLSSLPAYLKLPAIPLRNRSHRSLGRRLPPIQRARRPFPSLWLFPSTFVGAKRHEKTGGGQGLNIRSTGRFT